MEDAIREVPCCDGDPLGLSGLAPADECDGYIRGVYPIYARSRSEESLIDC